MQELAGLNSKWATTLMAQHLLAAADRYGLERLRMMCEANLCEVEMSIAWNALSEEGQSYVKQTSRLEMQVRKSKCR